MNDMAIDTNTNGPQASQSLPADLQITFVTQRPRKLLSSGYVPHLRIAFGD
jgi:hypothetical protein